MTCGGSALLLATFPEFVLRVDSSSDSQLVGISPNSPAADFYQAHKHFFRNLRIDFFDPYRHSGGFGASSAQFVTLYSLYNTLHCTKVDIDEMLLDYKGRNHTSSGITPSGADCVMQLLNSHAYFNSSTGLAECMSWDFDDIDFWVVKTGLKLATYSHLQKVLPDLIAKNSEKMAEIVEYVKKSWLDKKTTEFIRGILAYSAELECLGLLCPETRELLSEISQIDGVLATKGCGAMGADTVVVIFDKNFEKTIEKKLEKLVANRNIFKKH